MEYFYAPYQPEKYKKFHQKEESESSEEKKNPKLVKKPKKPKKNRWEVTLFLTNLILYIYRFLLNLLKLIKEFIWLKE